MTVDSIGWGASMGGAAAGTVAGGVVGTVEVPGIGTISGAAVGNLAGSLGTSWGYDVFVGPRIIRPFVRSVWGSIMGQ